MNLSRFTEKSQEALQAAQSLAERRQHQGLDVEHLAAALLADPDGLAPAILSAAGVPAASLRQAIDKELEKIPQVSASGGAQIYATPRLTKLLRQAEDETKGLK